ncbi:MAG: PAS domain-containing sensor histidine kinase [Ekhidna sp.]|nr:PAS domain-containing sensor histidine kinase [Ekhidna sp.]
MKINNDYLMSEKGFELLNKLFHSSGEGIMFFDKDGRIATLNPRAEQMFGYTEDEIQGQPVEILIPKASRSKHVGFRNEFIKHPSPRKMGESRDLLGVKKDESTFPLEVSLSYIKHEEEVMIVAFITDITVRKKNEKALEIHRKQLEEYTEQLEKKVKARTSELEYMNLGLQSQIQERKLAEEALKESLEELERAKQEVLNSLEKEKQLGELKSRFVSMASHEFRTPLTTVLSSANLIAKYTETDQQASRDKHIDRIRKSVQNLTSILNDFLSIEKLESGAQSVKFEEVPVKDLIEEVAEEMSEGLKENQKIDIQGEEVSIQSDPHILRNVLINLISNASKYSNPGDSIDIGIVAKNDLLTVSVRDYGIGIPAKEQLSLFGRFFRAGNATNIQGTGLGLNIVKKYVKLLNGYIDFESKEGKGSTFHIELPLK